MVRRLPIGSLAATGTRDGTTFLRGDSTWAVPAGGTGGGGGGVLLLEQGGSVPAGTAVGTILFRKAAADSAAYDAAVVSLGPAEYLPMQETSGTTATDSSGNSRNGTYQGGTVVNDTTDPVTPVLVGKHVRLDGSSGYVLLNNASAWFTPATAGFTFAGWFNVRSWPNWARFFDFANVANASDMYMGANNTGTAQLYVNGGTLIFGRPPVGIWHHVACTVTTAGAAIIYLDGAVLTSGAVGAPVNQTRQFKYIGKSASPDPYLPASVAKVGLWNKVLTAAQITVLAAGGAGKALGWWDGSTIQPLA